MPEVNTPAVLNGTLRYARDPDSGSVRYWTLRPGWMQYGLWVTGRSPPFRQVPSGSENGVFMKKSFVAFSLALAAAASVAALGYAQSATPPDSETVATITQMENDAVKADLAQDSSFYDRYLAEGWSGGTS